MKLLKLFGLLGAITIAAILFLSWRRCKRHAPRDEAFEEFGIQGQDLID
jgi:hypothetical protein